MTADLMAEIERYYDTVPRAFAETEEVGPFTLFRTVGPGWPYYARPRLGESATFTTDDVRRVVERQRELDVPVSLEWVAGTTPSLAEAARDAGLVVHEHPLMVLAEPAQVATPDGVRVEMLEAGSGSLAEVDAAVSAGFHGVDDLDGDRDVSAVRAKLASGHVRMAGAFDGTGVLGGGSHSPRGAVTELAGIAVLPRARARGVGAALTARLVQDAHSLGVRTVFLSAGDDRVAAIYARVGFRTIGTACVAEPPEGDR